MVTCSTTTLPCIKECKEGECALDRPFQKDLWIKAAEKLPEIDKPVLWHFVDGNFHVIEIDKDGNPWLSKATHWMPLPAPPRQ